MGPAGAHKVNSLYTFSGPQAPEQGKHVPEVGLELHSGPCNHWEVRKTKAIRASPTNVRPSPKRKSVDIVHTFFLLRFQLPRGHHRGFPLVTKHALSAKGIPVGLHPPIALALAKAVERIPEVGALPGSLLYEPKWDGYIHFTLPISGPSVPLPIKLNVFSAQRSGSVVSPLLFRRVLGHPRQTRVGASGRANMTHRPHSRHGQSRAGAFEASATATLRLWPRRATRECGLTTYMGGDFHRRR